MKRFLGLICLAIFALGCDDGDLSVTTFNFTSQNLNKCTNNTFIYNTNQNEVLVLDIPLSEFRNYETRDSEGNLVPNTYILNSGDNLVYRLYNGTVNNSVLCSDFPVSEPRVVEEWIAQSGATIEITTYANLDSENGGILGISGYTHRIVLKDVIFVKGSSQMVYEEYVFGNYTTTNLVRFNFTNVIQNCTSNDLLYKLNLKEAIVMDFDQNLFQNVPTNETPRTALVNSVTNPVIYKVFDNNITGAYFCSSIPQTTPLLVEEWYGENGVSEQSGFIEVETEEIFDEITGDLSGYIHHITLKNITFYNANSSFYFSEYYVGGYGIEL